MANVPFKNGDRILFQGDSITDCGCRDRTNVNPIGTGYVAMIRGALAQRFPELKVQVLNRGNSGDRTIELLARWQDECIGLKPTWLSIKIGVNDVWRKRDAWGGQGHVPLPEYIANYRRLLDQARDSGIKNLVLVSPTTIDDEPESELNELLAKYDAAVVELAKEYGAIYVPAREKLWKAIALNPEVRWTTDGCHPTTAGHGLIADAWLDAVLY